MKNGRPASVAILFTALISLASSVSAQVPSADALTLGGVKLGDTKPMVMQAASKLGLTLYSEDKYENKALAVGYFTAKDVLPQESNSLKVQFSPASQIVIGIRRSVFFEQKLTRANVFKAMIERFGKPQYPFGVDDRNIAKKEDLFFGFDKNLTISSKDICVPITIPQYRSNDECGLGIKVSFYSDRPDDYWTGQIITIFDYKTMNRELKDAQNIKEQDYNNKLKAAEKLSVPKL